MRLFGMTVGLALIFTTSARSEDNQVDEDQNINQSIIYIKLPNGETHKEETIAQIIRELQRRALRKS